MPRFPSLFVVIVVADASGEEATTLEQAFSGPTFGGRDRRREILERDAGRPTGAFGGHHRATPPALPQEVKELRALSLPLPAVS